MKNQKGFTIHHSESGFAAVLIMLILVGMVAIVGASYFFGVNKIGENIATPTPNISPSPIAGQATTGDMTNWKTYTNTKYGFSFKYPTTWKTDLQTISDSDKEYRFLTDKNEFINLIVMNGVADITNDMVWVKNINLNSDSYLIISYTDDLGPGSKGGVKDIKVFDQVLSTFKFTK